MNFKNLNNILYSAKELKNQELHPLIFIESLKLIYYPIPKVAATSFKYIFAKYLNYDEFVNIDETNQLHKIMFPVIGREEARLHKYKDFLKFSCVRNPWNRLISCYKSKIKMDRSYNDIHFKKGIDRRFLKYRVFKAGMSFNEFVKEICNIPDLQSDFHFRSQYDFIYEKNKIQINLLMKYENLENHFENLNSRIGNALIKLPKMNTTSQYLPVSSFYNDELIKLVQKRYEKDFQYFNYKDRP